MNTIDNFTTNDLKFTDPMEWAEKFFLESPEYSEGKLIKEVFEGKFNLAGFKEHLQEYVSAKVKGALEIKESKGKNGLVDLPSCFQIDDYVELRFSVSAVIKDCKIHSVRFTKGKTRYDIAIPDYISDKPEAMYTVIKNVDPKFIHFQDGD